MITEDKLRAGVAQIDITPPIGCTMTGYIARLGPAVGVQDPLYAKALVINDGQQQAALITCDVLGLDRAFVATARTAIEATTGIPGSAIMLAASHTHAGPATLFLQDCGEVDPDWLANLRQHFVDVVLAAQSNLRPAQFGLGRGTFTSGVHNRRAPGDIMDPEVGLLQVSGEDGSPLAILINYACHPTCLEGDNRLLSAEYPGRVAERIQRATGAITLFFTGAIGDVGPVARGWPVLEAIGNGLADEVLRVLPTITAQTWDKLATASQDIAMPLQTLPSIEQITEQLSESRRLDEAVDADPDPIRARVRRAMIGWAETTLAGLHANTIKPTVTTEVQVIRLGDLILVTAPGELFNELGLALKYASGAPQTFICGFANDNIGYIPARRAYPHGGYEIAEAYKYYGYPAALAPEAGESYVAAAVRLMHTM